MAPTSGNKRLSGGVDAAETRVGTVVAPTGCGCAAKRDAEAPPVSDGARRRAEPADRQSLALNTAPRHRTQSGSRAMNAGIAFQM